MSGKFEKKRSKKKGRGLLFVAVIVLILAVAAAAFLLSGGKESPAVEATGPNDTVQNETVKISQTAQVNTGLKNDMQILDVGSYTGAYVEDGSDEVVSGILMLKVINNGENTIEYAKLSMAVGDETAEFTVSTLKPGATIILLEKNRMQYDKTVDYSAASVICENVALFQELLTTHEDKLNIQILDGAINVTNISGEDITGRIAIYYKNQASGLYYGGITYRVVIENGLKAGEICQMMADHFSDSGSEILFVSIA